MEPSLTVIFLIVVALIQLLAYLAKKAKKLEEQKGGKTDEKPGIGQWIRDQLEELEKRTTPPQQQAPPRPPTAPAPRQQTPARPQPEFRPLAPPPPQPAPRQAARPPVRSGEPAPYPSGESLTTVDDRHLVNATEAEVREFTETIGESFGSRDISSLHYELDDHQEFAGVRASKSSQTRKRLRKILRRESIRDAIMLREILGPPIALRGLRGQDSER